MKLNIQERLTLVNLIPEKGNFLTMSIVEELRLCLYPSEKEIKEFDLKQEGNILTWNEKGSKRIEIKLTDSQKGFIMDKLEELSKENNLNFAQYSVYKRLKEESKDKSDIKE